MEISSVKIAQPNWKVNNEKRCLRVKEIRDERHPSINEDELATKSPAMKRYFTLRILPVVDENNSSNRRSFGRNQKSRWTYSFKNSGRIPVKDDKGRLV